MHLYYLATRLIALLIVDSHLFRPSQTITSSLDSIDGGTWPFLVCEELKVWLGLTRENRGATVVQRAKRIALMAAMGSIW